MFFMISSLLYATTYGGRGGSSVEYHLEFQNLAQGSNPYPNNMLGIILVVAVGLHACCLRGSLVLYPAFELVCRFILQASDFAGVASRINYLS